MLSKRFWSEYAILHAVLNDRGKLRCMLIYGLKMDYLTERLWSLTVS